MFCSNRCLEMSMNEFHQIECNRDSFSYGKLDFSICGIMKCLRLFEWNVDELEKFVESIEQQPTTVFDFDFGNRNDPMYEKNMIRVMLSQSRGISFSQSFGAPRVVTRTLSYLNELPKLKNMWQSYSNLFKVLSIKFFEFSLAAGHEVYFSKWINIDGCSPIDDQNKNTRRPVQRFEVKSENIGGASFPFGDSLWHSCDSNTDELMISNKLVTYVQKPIKKGSEIFRNYINTFSHFGPASERQLDLWQHFSFKCDCEACVNDWPTIPRLRSIDPSFQYPDIRSFASHDQAKKNIARNNAYVERNFKDHEPTQEVYITIRNNRLELQGLSRPSFYP
jgi:hypothetical protein